MGSMGYSLRLSPEEGQQPLSVGRLRGLQREWDNRIYGLFKQKVRKEPYRSQAQKGWFHDEVLELDLWEREDGSCDLSWMVYVHQEYDYFSHYLQIALSWLSATHFADEAADLGQRFEGGLLRREALYQSSKNSYNDGRSQFLPLRDELVQASGQADDPESIEIHVPPEGSLEFEELTDKERGEVLAALRQPICICRFCELMRPKLPEVDLYGDARALLEEPLPDLGELRGMLWQARAEQPEEAERFEGFLREQLGLRREALEEAIGEDRARLRRLEELAGE